MKSNALFGIYLAKSEISRLDKCILVEGNVDVVSMHQLGIRNVVASCGTSLTIEQIRLIKRFTDNVTIMYDGDGAGVHAAERGIGMILKERMNVRVVFLPEGQDPDDFARKHTLEEVREFISENEQDFISFKADRLMKEAENDPIRKAGLITDIADTIALVDDQIQRSVYVQSCAAKFGVSEDVLHRRINATRTKNFEDARKENGGTVSIPGADYVVKASEPAPAAPQPAKASMKPADRALDAAERGLLFYVLRYGRELLRFDPSSPCYRPEGPQTVLDFIDGVLMADEMVFSDEVCQRAYDKYVGMFDSEPVLDQDTIVRRLLDGEDREVAGLVSDIALEKHELSVKKFQSSLTALSTQLVKFVPESLLVYQKAKVEKDIADLTASMKDAPEKADVILRELVELNRIKRDLSEDLANMNR
ncbi:MAG: toprim domain-containing protein [Bacteroidales bacterium]|nr:toprim domain-containing protein [Bacteroidales bacterium]